MVEHANIIASVGQPKLIENVARSVGNDNNGLHTEPFLGRASMLYFLYGPGEPGRYHAGRRVGALTKRCATISLAGLDFCGSVVGDVNLLKGCCLRGFGTRNQHFTTLREI